MSIQTVDSYKAMIEFNGQYYIFPVIQIHIADHCTKKCEFCTTSSPHMKAKFSIASNFIRAINYLNEIGIRFKTINLCGGEPFSNKRLDELILELRNEINYVFRIEITTNGFWLDKPKFFLKNLKSSDVIIISVYADIVREMGGSTRYNRLISEAKSKIKSEMIKTESLFFREWELTETPKFGFPKWCGLASSITLTDDFKLFRCCVSPTALNNPNFRSLKFELKYKKLYIDLSSNPTFELAYSFLTSELPDTCGYCTAHYPTQYFPTRDIDSKFDLINFGSDDFDLIKKSGFSYREHNGVWSVATNSSIVIPKELYERHWSEKNGLWITFKVNFHSAPKDSFFDVEVTIPQEQYKDYWNFSKDENLKFNEQPNFKNISLPPKSHECLPDYLEINFFFKKLTSPSSYSSSTDTRNLGIFMQYMIIDTI